MIVQIDESGRDDQSRAIDFPPHKTCAKLADGDNFLAANGHVAHYGGIGGSIVNGRTRQKDVGVNRIIRGRKWQDKREANGNRGESFHGGRLKESNGCQST